MKIFLKFASPIADEVIEKIFTCSGADKYGPGGDCGTRNFTYTAYCEQRPQARRNE